MGTFLSQPDKFHTVLATMIEMDDLTFQNGQEAPMPTGSKWRETLQLLRPIEGFFSMFWRE